MDPFQIQFHDCWTNQNPGIHISELPDFRKIGPYSSGDHFSESCSPRKMVQNRIDEIFWGQTFKNTPYFNLRVPDFWKPWTCGYVAAGAFFFQKNGPHIFGSPEQVQRFSSNRGLWKPTVCNECPHPKGPFSKVPNAATQKEVWAKISNNWYRRLRLNPAP